MKTILAGLIIILVFAGCFRRELQADMVYAELIKVDTINRNIPNFQKQQLTWRDDYNLEYTSYIPLGTTYLVGTKMLMLRPK